VDLSVDIAEELGISQAFVSRYAKKPINDNFIKKRDRDMYLLMTSTTSKKTRSLAQKNRLRWAFSRKIYQIHFEGRIL
jgi:predicted transcriptional regulator